MLLDINPEPPLPPPASPPSGQRVQGGYRRGDHREPSCGRVQHQSGRDGGHVPVRAGPTLSGLNALTRRLGAHPGVVAAAEPTSMTWLLLDVALHDGGGSQGSAETVAPSGAAGSPAPRRHVRPPFPEPGLLQRRATATIFHEPEAHPKTAPALDPSQDHRT